MITLDNVKKTYGHVNALDGLTMHIEDGAMYGFVGPNGAGKSTAIQMMCGLEFPDEGIVMVDDMEAGSNVRRLKKRIGYVPDDTGSYPNLRIIEYMNFFADCYDGQETKTKRRIQMLLNMVGLQERQNQFMDSLNRGGQQKLSLARALIHDPKILILDEPTEGLDINTRFEFRQIIANLADSGKTIVISSHVLNEISELCTDIGIIDQGKMVMEGKIEDVLDQVNASNPIIISIAGNMSSALQTLRSDKQVRSVSIRNKDLLISYSGTEKDESNLLKKLVEGGVPVRGFHREKGNLESLFLQLTGAREERRVTYYEAESDFSEG
ncbi:ABC transporter ATP-binding protein [Oribacterium sp. WCC10]|uniref:ABC transporter ATP-binding protein n=1 Tax=Oribacterium sp. WCC10 TaxID=1855343 RepID=UPI0008E8C168|nr:ABC transporter ATP-binding protein [Oribacterium sp. WCC10]SFG39874.1 ABC-2 type transport system ATP-binding protein [Oribacterium sp. WCC10]